MGEMAKAFEDRRAIVAIDLTLGTKDLPKSALKVQCGHHKARNQGTKQGRKKAKTQMGVQRGCLSGKITWTTLTERLKLFKCCL